MTNESNAAITSHALTLASRVRVSPEVLLQETGGEAVLLDIASEHYFGLDRIGTKIWRLLESDPDLHAAYAAVLAEYDVPAERLAQDVIALVGQLADAGLVAVE